MSGIVQREPTCTVGNVAVLLRERNPETSVFVSEAVAQYLVDTLEVTSLEEVKHWLENTDV